MTVVDSRIASLETSDRPGRFEMLLPLLLAGYLFLDRTFAYLHIPGTPIFIGEIVLVFGLAGAAHIITWDGLWRRTNVPFLAALYAGWGLILLVPDLFEEDPVIAIRDATVWAYLLVALAVLGVLAQRPVALSRWFKGYRKILPVAIPWLAVSTVVDPTDFGRVPDSDIDLTAIAPGRASVHVIMLVGFLWLVGNPHTTKDRRNRLLLTGLGIAGVLALATKSRGGFLAAIIGASLLLLLLPDRSRLIVTASAALFVIALVTAIIDPNISVGERDLSATQFAENIVSIVTQQGDAGLSGNISWRLVHWGEIWEGVNRDVPFTGHGFGPNVAEIYHVPQTDIGLRNAHNTHLTIFARSGWIGFVLWMLMWGFWFQEVNATRRRLAAVGFARLSGLASWTIVAAAAMHVEAIFNPSIEGPQSAFWIWSVFAVGIFLVIASRTTPSQRPSRWRDDFELAGLEAAFNRL